MQELYDIARSRWEDVGEIHQYNTEYNALWKTHVQGYIDSLADIIKKTDVYGIVRNEPPFKKQVEIWNSTQLDNDPWVDLDIDNLNGWKFKIRRVSIATLSLGPNRGHVRGEAWFKQKHITSLRESLQKEFAPFQVVITVANHGVCHVFLKWK